MKYRDVIIGVVVLGLVAAGIYVARGRSAPAATSPGTAPGGDALPDVTLADGTADGGGVRITLSLSPNPPVAFAKTRVRVRAEAGGSAVALEDAVVSFEMTMPMGDHRYSLAPAPDGWQEAQVILPLCQSGKRRWYATVEATTAGQRRTARFRLDLSAPK